MERLRVTAKHAARQGPAWGQGAGRIIKAGVSKIYVAGAKIAAPKRHLAPCSPVRFVTLARKARGEQSP